MRLWLRHKSKQRSLHLWDGQDTGCLAVHKGLNFGAYEVTGKAYTNERICGACQFVIAVRKGKF